MKKVNKLAVDDKLLDLTDFYDKNDVYTKDEVNELIDAVETTHISVVETLPETGESNTIYFVPKDDTGTSDIYNEYAYINSQWEFIGNTKVDLSDYVDKESLLDLIYPVGSIYMTMTNDNPSSTFGGTWELMGQNRMLIGAGDTYTSGSTGGSADAVVVKHNHTQNSHNHTQNSHSHTQVGHYHNPYPRGYDVDFMVQKRNASERRQFTNTSGGWYTKASQTPSDLTQEWYTDTQTPAINGTTATNQATTATNQETGVDGAGKNLPPYLAVYMWRRTA